jgi:hypothetical protein
MIRNNQHKRIGTAKACSPRLSGRRRSTVAKTVERRFSKRRPSESINAFPAKVPAITIDYGLIAAGVAAAIGSVAFATFMISQNSRPEMLTGIEYHGNFASTLRARSHQSQVHVNNQDSQSIEHRAIDYNVTGSISTGGVGKAVQNTASASNFDGIAASVGDSTNNTYVLRFVHKDSALLQNDRGFYVARRGTILPGAGKVLSIERLGDKWILVTATQIFTEAMNNIP